MLFEIDRTCVLLNQSIRKSLIPFCRGYKDRRIDAQRDSLGRPSRTVEYVSFRGRKLSNSGVFTRSRNTEWDFFETLLPRETRRCTYRTNGSVRGQRTPLHSGDKFLCNSNRVDGTRIGVLYTREIVTVPTTLTLYQSTENNKLPSTDASSRSIRRVANR